MSGLNLRKRPRVCYYEPEEPPFDEYVYCAECGDYVYEYCSIHGPLLVIPDDKVVGAPPPGVPRAALTVPRVFLHLATSIIPGAGIGVFSSLALPSGVRFGPYRGARSVAAGDSDYGWQIFDKNHKPSHIVDAADDNRSNWMRYVNCARHCAEQNLVAYQYQGQLYYRTVKIIPRFSELLVFYGSEFARALGVDLRAYRAPCGCPYCQANEQKTALTKEKRQTKIEEKSSEEKILKVSPAEKIQETSTPSQVTLQNSDALPAPKKTKQNTFKRVTKKRSIKKVQNTSIDSQDNLQPDTKTAFSSKEKCTPEHSVHTQANLPEKVVTIPSFKSKKSAVKTSEKSVKAVTQFKVNLQNDVVSSYNINNTKEVTNKADLNVIPTNFKCDKCNKKFDIKSDLEKHLHTHALIESVKTDKKDFVCKNCQNTFKTKFLLIEHRTSQHGIKYFACTVCDYKTDDRSKLIAHEGIHTSEKLFKCEHCNYACSYKHHLLTHQKIHTGEKPFKCDHCNYACIQKHDLLKHQRIHTGEKPFKCDHCNYACSDKRNLLSHLRRHTGEKPFKCEHCNYACSYKHHLLVHQRIHTGEKPFKCDHCNYACSVKSSLVTHERIHTGEKPFKCDHCNYACNQKPHLLVHQRIHTGEKPFKCDHCNYACRHKHLLLTHQSIHTGEKPYKCDHCNYACNQKPHLLVHQRIHTGEKPFKCDICDYRTTNTSNLKDHLLRIHSGQKPFSCDVCSYKCAVKANLNSHLKKHK